MTPAFSPPDDLVFTAESDGTEQRYVQVLPVGLKEQDVRAVLIAFHGHGADRWQYVREGRGECRGARDVAARHGLALIAPEYRGASWMGPQAEADMLQLIGILKRRLRAPRIILTGGSMGGTAALIFAARHPELVAGVVSQNGLANFAGFAPEFAGIGAAIAASFGGSELTHPAEYRKRSAELRPAAFTMPLAITTGGRDVIVPPDSVLRLAAAVRQHNPRVLVLHRPEAGHETDYDDTVQALEFVILAS